MHNQHVPLLGKQLAPLLGIPESALSEAARDGRKVNGFKPGNWVKRDGGGRAVGYNVPSTVFDQLLSEFHELSQANSRPHTHVLQPNSGENPQNAALFGAGQRLRDAEFNHNQRVREDLLGRIDKLRDDMDSLERRNRADREDHRKDMDQLRRRYEERIEDLNDKINVYREENHDLTLENMKHEAGLVGDSTFERFTNSELGKTLATTLGGVLEGISIAALDGQLALGGQSELEYPDRDVEGEVAELQQAPPSPPPTPAATLLGELADFIGANDAPGFASRVVEAYTASEVDLMGWRSIANAIINHLVDSNWTPDQIVSMVQPLLKYVPADLLTKPVGEARDAVVTLLGLNNAATELVEKTLTLLRRDIGDNTLQRS